MDWTKTSESPISNIGHRPCASAVTRLQHGSITIALKTSAFDRQTAARHIACGGREKHRRPKKGESKPAAKLSNVRRGGELSVS
jgi:hypothetical protein